MHLHPKHRRPKRLEVTNNVACRFNYDFIKRKYYFLEITKEYLDIFSCFGLAYILFRKAAYNVRKHAKFRLTFGYLLFILLQCCACSNTALK